MKRLLTFTILVLLLSSVSPAAAADFELKGVFTGSSTKTDTWLYCDPNNNPVIFSGEVDVTGLETNGAVMFGLVDKGLIDSGDTGWGSGAYAYFGHIGTNIRVGPSDGFMGGELNQVGANVPYDSNSTVINFVMEIYAGQISVTYGGVEYVDTYGEIEDANLPDAYPGSEFDGGAYVAVNLYPVTSVVIHSISISGCVNVEGPIVSNAVASPNPVPVNGEVTLTATVDDTTTGNSSIASAEYYWKGNEPWMDMEASDGVFDEPVEEVTVSFPAPATPGIYEYCVRGTDAAGYTGADGGPGACTMFVVFDPDGSFVTGAGWIWSPPGAYVDDPSMEGVASFGFVSKYHKGADIPTGETQFVFEVAGLEYRSTQYDWLVVAGARAMFTGGGTLNGKDEYAFMLTAIDGQVNGGGGLDKFRIKIIDKNPETPKVVYDNMMGSEDEAEPTTVLGGGSIVIHTKK